jgi:hypothetical protein
MANKLSEELNNRELGYIWHDPERVVWVGYAKIKEIRIYIVRQR